MGATATRGDATWPVGNSARINGIAPTVMKDHALTQATQTPNGRPPGCVDNAYIAHSVGRSADQQAEADHDEQPSDRVASGRRLTSTPPTAAYVSDA